MAKYIVRQYPNGIVRTTKTRYATVPSKDGSKKYFTKIAEGMMCNNETGEVVEYSPKSNKSESLRSVCQSMSNTYDKLLNNIDVKKQKCFFVTLTNSDLCDFKEFERRLEQYHNKLNYACKKENTDYIYAFFKEANQDGRYHTHAIIAFGEGVENPMIGDPFFAQYWRYGCIKTYPIDTDSAFVKVLNYLYNYSSPERNEKVRRKIEGLKFFPSGSHLVKMTKSLKGIEPERFDNISKIIDGKEKLCESTRINAEGTFIYSTYIAPETKCA